MGPEIVHLCLDPSRLLNLHIGVMDYEPNHDAMMYWLKEVWPLVKQKNPRARMKIIGRNPRDELLKLGGVQRDVEITGEVDDIRREARGAMVMVCPMRLGSGMKNKILESFAMGIPVVSTREGGEGIEIENGKVGYIAENQQELANYVACISEGLADWKSLSKGARNLALEKYGWKSKAIKLSKILLN